MRSLDREKQSEHKVQVVAYDQGIPQKQSQATVTIHVSDVNDNAPTQVIITRPFRTNLQESSMEKRSSSMFLDCFWMFLGNSGEDEEENDEDFDDDFLLL